MLANDFAGLLQVIAVSLGSAGFLGFLSIDAKSIPFYFLCEVIAFAIAFALTYFYGKTKAADVFAAEAVAATADETAGTEVANDTVAEEKATLQDETIISPIVGQAVALSDVNDPVFSSGAMGRGIAIKPSEGVVYAPADAEVTIVFETGHAYGLKTANGAEILIHVGIDTVSTAPCILGLAGLVTGLVVGLARREWPTWRRADPEAGEKTTRQRRGSGSGAPGEN